MAKTVKSIIRYDGPALAEHEMDVYALAPALLALGDLCRTANSVLNGEMAAVKVLVRADIEQQCFQLQFELTQTLYDQVTTLLDTDRIKSASEILQWIGVVTGAAGAGIGFGKSLFDLYKFLSAQKPSDTIRLSSTSRDGSVTYHIVGNENTITVSQEVAEIAKEPRALNAVQRLLEPLKQDGYETLAFLRTGRAPTAMFTREQAQQVLALTPESLTIQRDGEQVSRIRTSVRVRKPVMEGDSMWGVNYKKAIEAKMLDEQWLRDYQTGLINLPVRSKLVVDLDETVPIDSEGLEAGPATYKIVKVHGVELPPEQYHLIPPEDR